MKEIKNHKIKIVVGFIITVLLIGSIFTSLKVKGLVEWNIENNEDFLKINVGELVEVILSFLSIIVDGFLISYIIYFFTKKDNKIEKQKEIIEKIISKIQEYINDNEIIGINEEIIKGDNLTLNLKLRKINNHIKYLEKFADKFDYKDLINNVNSNFHEYKEEICRMKEDGDFIKKSFNNLTRIIHLVDDGIEEILVKIYE